MFTKLFRALALALATSLAFQSPQISADRASAQALHRICRLSNANRVGLMKLECYSNATCNVTRVNFYRKNETCGILKKKN